eukprot:1502960-Pyramimonas_sp.AAC.3
MLCCSQSTARGQPNLVSRLCTWQLSFYTSTQGSRFSQNWLLARATRGQAWTILPEARGLDARPEQPVSAHANTRLGVENARHVRAVQRERSPP